MTTPDHDPLTGASATVDAAMRSLNGAMSAVLGSDLDRSAAHEVLCVLADLRNSMMDAKVHLLRVAAALAAEEAA